MTQRRFARVYYDDLERDYPTLFYDQTALGTWLRLLILSEKAWPALPELPRVTRRSDLDKLRTLRVLIDRPNNRFELRGWVKEREARAAHGKKAVGSRNDRKPDVPTPEPTRVPTPVGTRDLLTGAGASTSTSTSTSTSLTEGVQGEPDAAVAFRDRTGEFPAGKILGWINELGEAHGERRLVDMIARTPQSGTVVDYLRTVRDNLRAEDHAAEKAEKADEQRRLEEKRRPIPLRPVEEPEISAEEADRIAREYMAEFGGKSA